MNNAIIILKYSPALLLALHEEVSHLWRQKGHIYCTSQCYKFSIKT